MSFMAPQTIKALHAQRAEWGAPASGECPACGGLKWQRLDLPRGDPRFGQLVRCNVCGTNERLAWITAHCGLERGELGARLHHWRVGDWKDERRCAQRRDALGAMEDALVARAGFFTFWGDFGAGKSFALAIVVNEARLALVEAFYAPFALVLDHLRSLYRANRESSDFWQRLLDVPVLALDEVTRFHATDWARERLWMLADTRYRRIQSHLTLFAANDDPRESLPTTEAIGYLYSRMRQGRLMELRGDVRPAVAGGGK